MSKLQPPLKKMLSPSILDSQTVRRMWDKIDIKIDPQTSTSRERRGRWRLALISGFALAFFIGLLFFLPKRLATFAPQFVDGREFGQITTAKGQEKLLELTDGTTLSLGQKTSIDFNIHTAQLIKLNLITGRLILDIKHAKQRRWVIDSGLATVEVMGTHFILQRKPASLLIHVERGVILVTSEHLASRRVLHAGDSLEIKVALSSDPTKSDAGLRQQKANLTLPRNGTVLSSKDDVALASGAKRKVSYQELRSLAKSGAYQKVYRLLCREGLKNIVNSARNAEEILFLADIARRSGHPQEAVDILEIVARRFSKKVVGALAVFTLAKILQEDLSAADHAAFWFARALVMDLPVNLKEDAYLRLIKAHLKRGDRMGAEAASVEYRKIFPNGQHLHIVHLLLDQGQ